MPRGRPKKKPAEETVVQEPVVEEVKKEEVKQEEIKPPQRPRKINIVI